jgi:hypothetical protein
LSHICHTSRIHLWVLAGYAAVALTFAWPLPTHLGTHLTEPRGGDTDVYVWNQWVFRRELLERHHSPYFTDTIFSLSRTRANLSLHNYTTFQNVLALPLIGLLGIVATFNVIYLLMTLLTAYATFLLAKHVTGTTIEAWLAGLLFAWSPVLVTRGNGHFSLVAAAPLAVFMLLLLRAADRQRLRDAVALGATVWWAASTDVYYAVYCLLLAGIFLLTRILTVELCTDERRVRFAGWVLDILLFCVAGLVLWLLVSHGWQFRFLGVTTRVRGLYTPVLILTALAALRVGWRVRTSMVPVSRAEVWRFCRLAATAGVIAVALLSPALYAVGSRLRDSGLESSKIFWRSSPPGVDMLSLILPNPNHPLASASLRDWLSHRPNEYVENVASITFVALIVIAVAWRSGWIPPRLWATLAMFFGSLALGPFITIGALNTYVPGPWAVLRYLPIVRLARMPTRFSIVFMLAVAVLFASALAWLGRRWPNRRSLLRCGVIVLTLFELLPAPRQLHSAAVPRIYERVAAASSDVRVLNLPFGIRDGTSSVGNFSARSQFFQTMHGKRLIGGYLSRVSRRRTAETRGNEILDTLIRLSEGEQIAPSREAQLLPLGPEFVERSALGFVVIDRASASDALREFAIRLLRLQYIESDGVFELYRPLARPGS